MVHRVFLGLAFLLLEVLDSEEPKPVPAVRFPFPPPLSGCLNEGSVGIIKFGCGDI